MKPENIESEDISLSHKKEHIRKNLKMRKKNPFIFFDFEYTQDDFIECDMKYSSDVFGKCQNCLKCDCRIYKHKPNLCIVQKICTFYIDKEIV